VGGATATEAGSNPAPAGQPPAECPRCGRALPSPGAECPDCASHSRFTTSRQIALFVSLLILAALFLVAGFLTRTFRQHREQIARQWYDRGVAELKAGRAEAALNPLRTALVYSRDNPQYELSLAQALVAGQHYTEAQTYLLTLWERQPGSSTLNLELARLAARRGDITGAIRYYQASIYGVWESAGPQHRRAARLELIAYLSDHSRNAEALAETMEFAANLPPDPALHIQAGELFLSQKSYDHALEQFQEVLRMEPRNAAALAGAGRAAFETGDYASAERYLERASRAAPGDSSSAQLLALARSILSLDPEAPGLSAEARAARAVHVFTLAQARLAACPAPAGSSLDAPLNLLAQRAKALQPKVRKYQLARDMDLYSATVAFAFQVEQAALPASRQDVTSCGPGSVDDRALALLAERRSGGAR
jgi:predicted Zn-dependent protease